MECPKVSIIIASLNEELVIERCLKSIFSQTYKNFEVIVVDSSTDKTPNLVAKYNVKLLHHKPRGAGAAFYEGIKNASNDLVAFIGADDYVAPDYLEKNVKPFLESNTMGVHPIWTIIKPNTLIGEALYYYRQLFILKTQYSEYPQIWRRKIFEKISMDETLVTGEDADLWERVKNIADEKKWEFEKGNGVYYFADLEDTWAKNLRKSIWYGLGLVHIWKKYKFRQREFIPILFFSCAPFIIISYFISQNKVFILYFTLYLSTWLFVIIKAFTKRVLSWSILLIPPLLTWRAIGHLIGLILTFLPHRTEKWGGGKRN